MDIMRVTLVWSGFQGAPGYSNFFFAASSGFLDGGLLAPEEATQATERVRTSFALSNSLLPDGVQVRVDSEVALLNSDTGEVIGYENADVPGPTNGTGTGGYSAASGAVINWRTDDVRFGRRIRGRTFFVPLSGESYQDDGTLTGSALSSLRDLGDNMTSGTGEPDFGIWSRPRDGSGGVFATVVNSSVPDMAAVLRSRRD